MQNLTKKLKSLKNATQTQYDKTIQQYAKTEVIKALKEAGISADDLSEQDFSELLDDKIKESKAFTKGALVAGGALLFLEFLG